MAPCHVDQANHRLELLDGKDRYTVVGYYHLSEYLSEYHLSWICFRFAPLFSWACSHRYSVPRDSQKSRDMHSSTTPRQTARTALDRIASMQLARYAARLVFSDRVEQMWREFSSSTPRTSSNIPDGWTTILIQIEEFPSLSSTSQLATVTIKW